MIGSTKNLPQQAEETEACAQIRDAVLRIAADIDNPQVVYIKQLASFVLNNCYVIQITARDLDDGYVLFRSLNSRGQPLNELDIARAELLGAGDKDDVDQLARDWNTAEGNLGREEFAEYLESVLSLVVARPSTDGLRGLIKEALSDPLKTRNFRILLSSVLRHSAKLDDGMLEFGDDSDKIHRVIECLRQSPITEWRSVALRWLALNPTAFNTLQFLTALDSLCLGLLIIGKNKTQILSRLRALVAEVQSERELVLAKAGALRFSSSEQARIKSVLMHPIGAKKRFLKPLLLRLNAHMLDPAIPIYFPEGVTIEHVLPQRPKVTGPWIEKYPDVARRKICTELLGNYAILTHPINARAKNYDFTEKRRVIFSMTNGQAFPITNDLTNYVDWGESALLQRHQKLVRVACELLGLSPSISWTAAAE